jgi:hypothetical protein
MRLGDVYRDGKIVKADGERAVGYYLRAATGGTSGVPTAPARAPN